MNARSLSVVLVLISLAAVAFVAATGGSNQESVSAPTEEPQPQISKSSRHVAVPSGKVTEEGIELVNVSFKFDANYGGPKPQPEIQTKPSK